MYSSSLPLSFSSPTHFQKPTYTFNPRLDFLPPVPVKRALSTANSFLNNYTYHCWFCNFLGLSLYLLALKNDIMTAMNLLEFTWKLRWQGVCLGTLRSMSKYCKCSINVFVIIMKWIIMSLSLAWVVLEDLSVAQMVKNLPAMWETRDWSLDLEDPLEKEMATHSSISAWRIPQTEEPGRLQSMESQRVRHNWATSLTHPLKARRSVNID